MFVVEKDAMLFLFYHRLMHLTAYQCKFHQQLIAAHGGEWGMSFYRIKNDHQLLGSLCVCGNLPSMIFASPLDVSGHWHFVQEIG